MRLTTSFALSVALALTFVVQAGAQSSDVTISPNDVLTVTVWNQPELSGKFIVQADGGISFPLVGRVTAGGLPPRQVEETLARLLSKGYVKAPQVSLAVERSRAATVYVTGEVRQPGAFPLAGPMTLIEVLARAGSTTEKAGAIAIVTRIRAAAATTPEAASGCPAATRVTRVDLKALQDGAVEDAVILCDGDTVVVPRAETIYVVGEVRNPGNYPLHDRITVLQALALAGGLTERGSDKRIRISRNVDGRSREIKVTLGDVLQAGDTIIFGERRF